MPGEGEETVPRDGFYWGKQICAVIVSLDMVGVVNWRDAGTNGSINPLRQVGIVQVFHPDQHVRIRS